MPQQSSKSKATRKDLNARQKAFCRYYIENKNQTNAAKLAGYAENSAHVEASRLIKNPKIKAEIERLQDTVNRRLMNSMVVTREDWLTEMAKIGFSNMGDHAKFDGDQLIITDTDDLNPEQQAAIAEMGQTVTQHGGSTRIKLHDKQKALTAIGQAQGWYIQPSGDGDGNGPSIQVTVQMPSNGRDGQQSPKAASAVAKSTW